MKYFVVADVHGYYDQMKAALDAAGFDPENPNHTLISCGDAIDRGPRPNEVIKYFVNLPRKILIRGNHEDLLDELLRDPIGPRMHDHQNGTYNTAIELASKCRKVREGYKISKTMAQYLGWEEVAGYAVAEPTYRKYRDLLVDYAEVGNYIFVHGWLPCVSKTDIHGGKLYTKYKLLPNWRDADLLTWEKARWINGFECTVQNIFEDGKTIVCGHIHAAAWNEYFYKKKPYEDHNTYVGENVIALDTCTALSKKVNVLVIEV